MDTANGHEYRVEHKTSTAHLSLDVGFRCHWLRATITNGLNVRYGYKYRCLYGCTKGFGRCVLNAMNCLRNSVELFGASGRSNQHRNRLQPNVIQPSI